MAGSSINVGTARVNFIANSQAFVAGVQQAAAAYGPYISQLNALNARQTVANATVAQFTQSMRSSLIATLGYVAGIGVLRTAIDGIVGSTLRFDEGLIDVSKTTGLNVRETEILGREIVRLTTRQSSLNQALPVTTRELLSIAVVAGQMRIQGVPALRDFAETVSLLILTTNLGAEGAANSLGKILALTSALPEDVLRLGSVITRLGNEFRGGETEILAQAQSIAAATSQYELHATTLLGVSAVLSQAGVQAESSGTVIQRVLQLLSNASEQQRTLIANAARISRDDLDQALALGDREQQLRIFIRAVASLGDQASETGAELSRAAFLESLFGESNVRITRVVGVLARRYDELTRGLNTGKHEWEEATALVDEATRKTDAYRSALRVARNGIEAQGLAIGQTLLPALTAVIEQYRAIEIAAAGATVALGVGALRRRGQARRDAASGQIALGLASVLGPPRRAQAPAAALGTTARGAAIARSLGTGLARTLSFVGGPIGILIGLVASLGVSMLLASRRTDDLSDELAEAAVEAGGAAKSLDDYRSALARLREKEAALGDDAPGGSRLQRRAQAARERRRLDLQEQQARLARIISLAEDADKLAAAEQRLASINEEIARRGRAGRRVQRADTEINALRTQAAGLRAAVSADSLFAETDKHIERRERLAEIDARIAEIERERGELANTRLRDLRQERDGLQDVLTQARELAEADATKGDTIGDLAERLRINFRAVADVIDEARGRAATFFGDLNAGLQRELRETLFRARELAGEESRLSRLRFETAEQERAKTDAIERELAVRRGELERLAAYSAELESLREEAGKADTSIGSTDAARIGAEADEVAAQVENLRAEIKNLQRELDALRTRQGQVDDTTLQDLAAARGRSRLAEIDAEGRARGAPSDIEASRAAREAQLNVERTILDDIFNAEQQLRRQAVERGQFTRRSRTEELVRLQARALLTRELTGIERQRADALAAVANLEERIAEIRSDSDGSDLTNQQLEEIGRLTKLLGDAQEEATTADLALQRLKDVNLNPLIERLAHLTAALDHASPLADALAERLIVMGENGKASFEGLRIALEGVIVQGVGSFGDALVGLFDKTEGRVESFSARVRAAFSALAADIARDLLRVLVRAVIVESILAAIYGVLGRSPTPAAPQGYRGAPYRHSGGMVGEGMPYRPPGALAPNERVVILQDGEEVLTRRSPRHRYNLPRFHEGGVIGGAALTSPSGAPVQEIRIINEGAPAQIESSRVIREPDRVVTQIVLADFNKRGPISRAVRATR